MTTPYEIAKSQGYSDQEIQQFLNQRGSQVPNQEMAEQPEQQISHEDKYQQALQSGYTKQEIDKYLLSQKSKAYQVARKTGRHAAQIGKGSLNLNPYVAGYNLLTTLEREGAYKSRERVTEQAKKDLERIEAKKAAGEPLTRLERIHYDKTKQLAERKNEKAAGIDTESLINAGVKATTGIDLAPEDTAEHVTNIVSSLVDPRNAINILKNIKNIPTEAKNIFNSVFGKEVEKLPSGLTKLKAVDTEKAHLAKLSSAAQKTAIGKLNQEASTLTEKAVQSHLPFAKKIEEGFDFPGYFEKGFGELQSVASKANPEIDITPVSNLLRSVRDKYRGIPTLHSDAVKIGKEVKAFSNNPQTGLKNLLKIYRSNNQKVKHIAETAFAGGRQKEYVDFLLDMNKNIAKSIENTLPKDSAWVKQFRDFNKEYGQFRGTERALKDLQPLLGENPSATKLASLSNDERVFSRLSRTMGEKGANEVRQIARDLKTSIEAIKKIPKFQLEQYEKIFPIAYLIPGIGKIAAGATALKSVKIGKYVFGSYLMTAARRKLYRQAVQSLEKQDLKAYKAAVVGLQHAINDDKED